jgi:hypothetical protein
MRTLLLLTATLVLSIDPEADSTRVEWGLCDGEFRRIGSVDTTETNPTLELPIIIGRHCGRVTSYSEGGASDSAWFGVSIPEPPTVLEVL